MLLGSVSRHVDPRSPWDTWCSLLGGCMPSTPNPGTSALPSPLSGVFSQIHGIHILHFCSDVTFSLRPFLTTLGKFSDLPLDLSLSPQPASGTTTQRCCLFCTSLVIFALHLSSLLYSQQQGHHWAQSNGSINM